MGSLLGAGGLLDVGLIRGWGLNKLSRWTKVLSGWSCSTEMLHTASPGKGGGFLDQCLLGIGAGGLLEGGLLGTGGLLAGGLLGAGGLLDGELIRGWGLIRWGAY